MDASYAAVKATWSGKPWGIYAGGNRPANRRGATVGAVKHHAERRHDDVVRVGVMLPSRETAMSGAHDAAELMAFATDAEQAGFDSVWAGDSPLARPRMDPMALLAATAARTTRVRLGTAALTAALRHPLLGAHTAASVDQLAGGRLVLALGAGFPIPESRAEFEALGVPFRGRSHRLDSTVAVWRSVWAERSSSLPPVQPGGPQLWLAGGDAPGVIERSARLYDGWLPFLPDAERYAAAYRTIQDRAADEGRQVTPGMYATVHIDLDEDRARRGLDEYLRAYYGRSLQEMAPIQASCAGSSQRCLEWLASYVQAGARHLVLRFGSVDSRHQLHLAADELLPALRRCAV